MKNPNQKIFDDLNKETVERMKADGVAANPLFAKLAAKNKKKNTKNTKKPKK